MVNYSDPLLSHKGMTVFPDQLSFRGLPDRGLKPYAKGKAPNIGALVD